MRTNLIHLFYLSFWIKKFPIFGRIHVFPIHGLCVLENLHILTPWPTFVKRVCLYGYFFNSLIKNKHLYDYTKLSELVLVYIVPFYFYFYNLWTLCSLLGFAYLGGWSIKTCSYRSPCKNTDFTSSWKMDHEF